MVVVGSERRVHPAQRRLARPVEGRLDGDGGVTRTVEPQRVPVARPSGVTGDDPGQIVCQTKTDTDELKGRSISFFYSSN